MKKIGRPNRDINKMEYLSLYYVAGLEKVMNIIKLIGFGLEFETQLYVENHKPFDNSY